MKHGIIHFLTHEEGGRKQPPTLSPYYAITYIEHLECQYWSIVIQFEKPLQPNEYMALCEVTFLMDNAPFYILEEIEELSVYEGAKMVAKIVFK